MLNTEIFFREMQWRSEKAAYGRGRVEASKQKWIAAANAHARNGETGLYIQCMAAANRGELYPGC